MGGSVVRFLKRRFVVLGAAALALVAFGPGLASAARPAAGPSITFIAPSPSEGATLTTDTIAFSFTYDKKPNATRTLVCALTGPTASSGACDAPVASGKGSQSGEPYSGLANGSYTFTVTLTLTNGVTASATRQFTVAVPAPRHVYWTTSGAIGRANVDGTGANQSFITGLSGPFGVAVDTSHVYWADFSADTIGRANLDGTGSNGSFITGALDPASVAVDAGHIYWANFSLGATTGSIGRANLDGTGVNQTFITTGDEALFSVAVDASHIYWTNSNLGTIGRANLDGTGVDQGFITISTSFDDHLVAVDAGHIYWSNNQADTIGRANIDGTGVNNSFITGASAPAGLAVDSGHVYWASTDNTGRIGRANIDGTGVNDSFITGASSPFGVTVDAE